MTLHFHSTAPICAARAAARALLAAALGLFAASAAQAACPGYSTCPAINYPAILKANPDAIAVATGIEASEQAALAEAGSTTLTRAAQIALLGKLIVFDRRLSVNQNEACMSCHTAGAGFTGGISKIDFGAVPCSACHGAGTGNVGGTASAASFPGSVTTRTGNRKPMSLAYAAFAPVLHIKGSDFVGGNFWDDRATGLVTGSPAGDQALGPFTNPVEMALPDPACVVYRIASGGYAAFFSHVHGAKALAIDWPAHAEAMCASANDGAANQTPLHLSAADRATATATFHLVGTDVAAFEASAEVSPFSSKFDAYLQGKATLTPQEAEGLTLFRGQGGCDKCHTSEGKRPLFTDFTSVNIGIPPNPMNPFFIENAPDKHGYVANPAGDGYVDPGLAGFLSSAANTNPAWQALAPQFLGTFQAATLRNVAAVPRSGFRRAYMHNGEFTDLPTVVHFYNTRDVLPHCETLPAGTARFGVNCWPAPAVTDNLDTTETGNLGLSSAGEADLVAFLGTLTDGYVPTE